jgi:hypothetical protein
MYLLSGVPAYLARALGAGQGNRPATATGHPRSSGHVTGCGSVCAFIERHVVVAAVGNAEDLQSAVDEHNPAVVDVRMPPGYSRDRSMATSGNFSGEP